MTGTQDCGAPALFRYTWPGKDEAFACMIHANGILNVAEAIGLHLQMIRLDYRKLEAPLPTCSSKVRSRSQYHE